MSNNEIPIYELNDGTGETIRIKPCRQCYANGHIFEPQFYWISDDTTWTNMWRVYCPNCGLGMVEEHMPDNLETRWNNWDQPLESWNDDLDW